MTKKITAGILAGAMVITMFSGCSKTEDEDKVSSDSTWYNITKTNTQEFYNSVDFPFDNMYSRYIGKSDDRIVLLTDMYKQINVEDITNDYRSQDYNRTYLDLYSIAGEYLNSVPVDDYIDIDKSYYISDAVMDGDKVNLSVYVSGNDDEDADEFYLLTYDPVTGEAGELTTQDMIEDDWGIMSEKVPNGVYEGSWSIGEYTVYKYYVYEGNEEASYVLIVKDADGHETVLDLRTLLPGKSFYDISTYIPIDDSNILIPPSADNPLFFTIDLSSKTVTDVTEEYSWLQGDLYNLTYVEGQGLFFVDVDYNTYKSVIKKIDFDTQQVIDYIDLSCSNINPMDTWNLSIINITDNGAILAGSNDSIGGDSSTMTIYALTEAESNPNAGKTILKAASLNGYNYAIYESISRFNESNSDYFIELDDRYNLATNLDYENMGSDWTTSYLNTAASLGDQLTVDLMAGDGPDILFNAYSLAQLNNSDYLVDLSDRVGDSSKYFTNIFDAMRVDGALYQVPLLFTPMGITTYDEYVEDGAVGFTFEDYIDFVDRVCNGDDPINETTQLDYFMLCYYAMADQFVSGNSVNYNNDAFRALAEYVKDHYNDSVPDYHDVTYTYVMDDYGIGYSYSSDDESDEPKASYGGIYSISDFFNNYGDHAAEMRILGLPSSDARGPMFNILMSVGISASSSNLDGCYQFLEQFLDEEMQLVATNNDWGTPVNISVFEQIAQRELESHNRSAEYYLEFFTEAERHRYGMSTTMYDESVIEYYESVIQGCDRAYIEDPYVSVILREEMQAYFAGQKNLDTVIDAMTNRVSTYLSERG